MKSKRIISGLIGLPIVALIFIFANKYIIDVIFSIIAIIALHEYLKAFKNEAKPVKWIAYLVCILIAFLHVIPTEKFGSALSITITSIIAILFIKVIISSMKTKISDIMITVFGICYVVLFIAFIPLLYGTEIGKYLIWYLFISAWGSDTCAYFVGSKYGKHKFSKISPKKSVEGCIRRCNWSSVNFSNIYSMYKQICILRYIIYIHIFNYNFIKYTQPNWRFICINNKKNCRYKRLWKSNTRTWRNT